MINWRERIAEKLARKEFEWNEEESDALGHFETCLVGEQHMKHPEVVLYAFKGPVDHVLLGLGLSPSIFIGPQTAERVLDKIEDRVLQLKRGE